MYFLKIVHAMWIPKNRNPLARGHPFFFGLGEILVIRNHEIRIDPDARDRARVGTEPEQEI